MDPVKKTLTDLEKMGIVMKPFGEYGKEKQTIQYISTGSLTLDSAIGLGGYPRGRLIEMYGREGCGKSTMCLITIANIQKAGGAAAYIDPENGFDPAYAKDLGVDVDNLLYTVPENGEQGFEALIKLVESNTMDFIVVDSLAALVPQTEIDNPMVKDTMALQARLVGKGLRKLSNFLSKSKTVVVFINQIREKPGVMYGNPETTPGGLALKFGASLRMQVYREKESKIVENGKDVGHSLKVKIVKNKVGIPFSEAVFAYRYKGGIDVGSELLEVGLKLGVIKLEGRTYTFTDGGEVGTWVGKEACFNGIRDSKPLQERILAKITEAKDSGAVEVQPDLEEAAGGKKKTKKG